MLLVNSIHFYKKNIVAVYTFDAPGLHKELTETAGYQNMMEKNESICPTRVYHRDDAGNSG